MKRIVLALGASALGLTLAAGAASAHPAPRGHARAPHGVHARRAPAPHIGRDHHWGGRVWSPAYHRYHYWEPDLRCYFYWDADHDCCSPCP